LLEKKEAKTSLGVNERREAKEEDSKRDEQGKYFKTYLCMRNSVISKMFCLEDASSSFFLLTFLCTSFVVVVQTTLCICILCF